ncbi:HEPN domain-containing protein [Blastomonas aquatica]|uniref:Apea-like HEPN domain-containing protein n=1 Tax=Blastomonas aquatica TaxID=1510276 RepID=A0ABQ1JKP1_9SPHN|nr:HEPN domain-containing protein [Blastomonas aquatica]GGB69547.1 hypothetical protein GCM10010833_25970 [Blastomonas aquatica]
MSDNNSIDSSQVLVEHFKAALDAVIAAVHTELAAGKKPKPKNREPSLSMRENGMPSLSDGNYWDETGPRQYADLLNRVTDVSRPFANDKFEVGRFPEVDALVDFVAQNQTCSPVYQLNPEIADEKQFNFNRIKIELQLEHATNRYFARFGEVPVDKRRRIALLRPFVRGLFSERLDITNLIPITLVKFDFDRMRIADNAFVFRMSDALQRARWSGKAYGASGHEGVLSAATHAFAITGWHWPNTSWLQMANNLSVHNAELREEIDLLFAALRLATGVSTGYAQELRVNRGWTHFQCDLPPELVAAGARRYPEEFDDFGWMQPDLPTVTRSQMRDVQKIVSQMRKVKDERLILALRRFNGAMIRSEMADVILDATIALEILLSDGDNQSIGYKLRLRAGALANLDRPGSGLEISETIKQVYEARSRIVHGGRRTKTQNAAAKDEVAKESALGTLRRMLLILLDHPRFLDPKTIDSELLLG